MSAPRAARGLRVAAGSAVPALLLAACSGVGVTPGPAAGPPGTPSHTAGGAGAAVVTAPPVVAPGEVVVLVAASLTDVMAVVAEDFEAAHPGTRVTVVPGASSGLARQVLAGSPGDVLVSAAPAPVQQLVAAGAVLDGPVDVARNSPVLAVPAGNPAAVTGLADLAEGDLVVSLCEPLVPCGAVTAELLAAAGVDASPDSLERDVRAVLTRIALDEADAGVVYRTDALAASEAVDVVEVPGAADVTTSYPAVVLAGTTDRARAGAFLHRLRSPAVEQALTRAGFRLP